jgi:hypothetical protein
MAIDHRNDRAAELLDASQQALEVFDAREECFGIFGTHGDQ